MPQGNNGGIATNKIRYLLDRQKLKSYIVCLTAQREDDFDLTNDKNLFDEFLEKPLKIDTIRNIILKVHQS